VKTERAIATIKDRYGPKFQHLWISLEGQSFLSPTSRTREDAMAAFNRRRASNCSPASADGATEAIMLAPRLHGRDAGRADPPLARCVASRGMPPILKTSDRPGARRGRVLPDAAMSSASGGGNETGASSSRFSAARRWRGRSRRRAAQQRKPMRPRGACLMPFAANDPQVQTRNAAFSAGAATIGLDRRGQHSDRLPLVPEATRMTRAKYAAETGRACA